MNEFALDLIIFLRNSYSPIEEKTKEGKNGEITTFFRKGGRPLCYMHTKDGRSTVTIVIGSSLEEKVFQLGISNDTKVKFQQAKQYHDGRWLSFDLVSHIDLEDIKKLLLVKQASTKM